MASLINPSQSRVAAISYINEINGNADNAENEADILDALMMFCMFLIGSVQRFINNSRNKQSILNNRDTYTFIHENITVDYIIIKTADNYALQVNFPINIPHLNTFIESMQNTGKIITIIDAHNGVYVSVILSII